MVKGLSRHLQSIVTVKMWEYLTITILVCLYVTLPNTDACSCQLSHPQDHFCNADFVIKAKIKSMKQIFAKRLTDDEEVTIREPFENRYSVRIKDVYKGADILKNVSQNHVYTPSYGSLCGVDMGLGQQYVITGHIRNNKIYASLCDFVRVWDSLPKWQRRGIADRYAASCDCQIKVCFNDNCYHKNRVEGREDICILEWHRDKTCTMSHSFCKRKEGHECGWAHTSQWRECRRRSNRVYIEP